MSVYHVCAWCPPRPKEELFFPGTGNSQRVASCHMGTVSQTWVLSVLFTAESWNCLP